MKVGIVGIGVVGGACKFGFELLGHHVAVHDIALDTTLDDVVESEIVYICVPTPATSMDHAIYLSSERCSTDSKKETTLASSRLSRQSHPAQPKHCAQRQE